MDIKFDNKIHSITFGSGEIDQEGRAAIQSQLFDWDYPIWNFPEWWEWTAVVPKGKYSGTFVKRVSKYFYEKGIKLKQEHASALGSLVGKYSFKNDKFYFRFSKDDWESGDFGDDGSCYWTERRAARKLLRNNGMGAVQFFDGPDGEGVARALLYKCNDWVLFNGYGLDTIKIARIVSQYLGVSYRQVFLCNYDSTTDLFYFNRDGLSSYVLTNNLKNYAEPPEYTTVDLKIDYEGLVQRCKYCNLHTVSEELNSGFCEICIEDANECAHCNEMFIDQGYRSDQGIVCGVCVDQLYSCDCCALFTNNLVGDIYRCASHVR